MKNLIKPTIAILLIMSIISCASNPSLQKYYIDKADDKNFVAFDLSPSFIQLKDDASEEAKETLKSLKKVNVLAFVKDENNKADYLKEKNYVNGIVKNDKYQELFRANHKGNKILVQYEGDEDAQTIDELVVYANNADNGFALVRVLGDGMKPANIMKLGKYIQDVDAEQFESLKGIFGKFNKDSEG